MSAYYPGRFSAADVSRYGGRSYELLPLEPPRALRRGYDTAVWWLAARTGAYVVKIFAAGRLETVQAEVDLIDYLRARGIRTPAPIENRSGQRVGLIAPRSWRALLRANRFPVIVMPFEDTRSARAESIARDDLSAIGQAIGLMHRELQVYPRRDHVRRFEHWHAPLGRFDDFLESANARPYDAAQHARWRELDRRMERSAGVVRRLPLTRSVLHGDLGLDHVRLPTCGPCASADVGFLDFSDFSFGPVVCDLAAMLSRLYWESDIGLDRWRELRAWLLQGYASAFALTEDDRAALDYALLERLLIEVRYLNRVSLKMKAPYGADGLKRRYELAAHVLEQGLQREAEYIRKAARDEAGGRGAAVVLDGA